MSTFVPKSLFSSVLKAKIKKIVLAAMLFATVGFGAVGSLALQPVEASSINIWWPTQNVSVTGTQPFKAELGGGDINAYNMYWQVDGGTLNYMSNSSTDAPHKEASVDLSSWNWHGSGPYTINFVAKDFSGNVLAQQAAQIFVGNNAGQSAPGAQTLSAQSVNAQAISAQPNVQSANAPSVQTNSTVNNWWPVQNAVLSGSQPFKAAIDNLPIDDYSISWQVDGGTLNAMNDNSTDAPHKEASVDLSSWNWHGSGPYTINFVAKDNAGNVIGQKSVNIFTASNFVAPQTQPQPNPIPNPTPTNTVLISSNNSSSANGASPFAGQKLWVNPNSDAANYANNPANSAQNRALMQKVAAGAETQWFSTDWIANMQQAVHNYVAAAQAAGAMPTMVLYNIPYRDCGQFSAGGANDPNAYKQTVDQFAAGIGNAKTAVIIEPDALALTSCLNSSQLSQRFSLLQYAVQKFAALGNTATYLDIGHPDWLSAQQAASMLSQGGVQNANGFALNVSNFYTTQQNIDYGSQIVSELSKLGINGKHFVIDTGRNGNGSDGNWCNPSGRALGQTPTANTGNPLVDALLWVKGPGGSDGTCNGGPAAGVFWPAYALGLAQNAH